MISADGTQLVYGQGDADEVLYHVPETGVYTITVDVRDWNNRTVKVEKYVEPEPVGPQVVTVAKFNAAPDDESIEYQVSGTISEIYQAYNSSYNNIAIYIADETGVMLAYRLSCEGIDDPANTLTVGDLITVKGYRTLYNEKPQMAQGCVIVSHEDVVVEEPEEVVPDGAAVASLVFAEAGYTNSQSVDKKTISLDENVSVVFAQGTANNAPAYYDSGSAIRMYQNGATLTVSALGKKILSIELTFAQGHYYLAADSGELSAENTVRTWTGEAETVKFTSTGTDKNHRAYVSAIKVIYQ